MTSPAPYQRGDRVALVRTDDPDTRLRPGDQGTVIRWDPAQSQLHIRWDCGSSLSMLPGEGDQVRVLAPGRGRGRQHRGRVTRSPPGPPNSAATPGKAAATDAARTTSPATSASSPATPPRAASAYAGPSPPRFWPGSRAGCPRARQLAPGTPKAIEAV